MNQNNGNSGSHSVQVPRNIFVIDSVKVACILRSLSINNFWVLPP